jgi:hypothetical protein
MPLFLCLTCLARFRQDVGFIYLSLCKKKVPKGTNESRKAMKHFFIDQRASSNMR